MLPHGVASEGGISIILVICHLIKYLSTWNYGASFWEVLKRKVTPREEYSALNL